MCVCVCVRGRMHRCALCNMQVIEFNTHKNTHKKKTHTHARTHLSSLPSLSSAAEYVSVFTLSSQRAVSDTLETGPVLVLPVKPVVPVFVVPVVAVSVDPVEPVEPVKSLISVLVASVLSLMLSTNSSSLSSSMQKAEKTVADCVCV